MKNKKFVIVLVFVFLASLICFSVGFTFGGQTYMRVSLNGIIFNNDKTEIVSENFSDEIDSMEIYMDYPCDISFVQGERFSVEYDKEKVKLEQEKNGLEIADLGKSKGFTFGIDFDIDQTPVTITVPKEKTFDVVKINSVVGRVEINGINTNVLELNADVSETFIKNSGFEMELDIVSNVGNVMLENCYINKEANFQVNVGNLDLNLIGNENEYRVKSEVNIGQFDFDNNNSETATVVDKNINIAVNVGNCDLSFTQESE